MGRSIISLPQHISLTGGAENELRAGFSELVQFCEFVHVLASSRRSPYPSESIYFAERPYLYQLLSGAVEDLGDIRTAPQVYILCRLSVLMYILTVFLDHHHYLDNVRLE